MALSLASYIGGWASVLRQTAVADRTQKKGGSRGTRFEGTRSARRRQARNRCRSEDISVQSRQTLSSCLQILSRGHSARSFADGCAI